MFLSKTKSKGQSSDNEILPIRGVSPPYTTDFATSSQADAGNENQLAITSAPPTATTTIRPYPHATAIPGRPGYVYSPYSRRVIDVVSIASGTLVNEPQSPDCAKKYFYVP